MQTADHRVGFNGRLGGAHHARGGDDVGVLRATGLMGVWVLLALIGILRFDPYPFGFLLFLGNIVQLLLMFVIMVGQNVLGEAADDRAVNTFYDAEAILHECGRIQRHLAKQDREFTRIISHLESLALPV